MPASNVLDWNVAAWCQMLYPPGWDCSSFTPTLFVSCAVSVRDFFAVFSVSSAPSVNWGPVCCVQVRWRKPAGTEDPPKKLEDSTEDRSLRRLRVDSGVEASWEDAPDKFGFGAVQTASKSGGRRKKSVKKTEAAD